MSTISNLSFFPAPPSDDDIEKLLNELPKARFWESKDLSQYKGFWFPSPSMKSIITFRSTFLARDDDVILASSMKTGTTWLKALSVSIMQRKSEHVHAEPPFSSARPTETKCRTRANSRDHEEETMQNPHFHVPTIEAMVYSNNKGPEIDLLNRTSTPRLLHTHMPYTVLPDSIKNSSCKIVYIARNPKDTLISMWHFFNTILRPNDDPFPLENAFDCFCAGVHQFGPFFDHVVKYWQESQKTIRPRKILFVKYEELKRDPKRHVSEIAEFLGKPFGDENEVEEVLWRCSLERLKNLEVNRSEFFFSHIPNKSFYRKGDVGDWKNYLTPEMDEQINQISRIKLQPFGLFL